MYYSHIISTYTVPAWISDESKDMELGIGVIAVQNKHMMTSSASCLAIGRTDAAQYPCVAASLQYMHKHN